MLPFEMNARRLIGIKNGMTKGNAMSRSHEGFPVDRRRVLCGGGGAVFSTMIASLLGTTKAVRATPISGAVPEVDGLAVRVVIDSYQFALRPAGKWTVSRYSTSAGA